MKPYSEDLRARIVAGRQAGHSAQELANRFKVSKRSVERYWKLQVNAGHVQPRQIGGYRRSRLARHDATLRNWIQQQNDLTLAELKERCWRRLRIRIGLNALWKRLEKLGLNYKKNRGRRRAATR
jgi:transposase